MLEGKTNYYYVGTVITRIVVFVAIWIYSFSSWGLLFGIMFGWIPALIGCFIAGLIWPVILLGTLILFNLN